MAGYTKIGLIRVISLQNSIELNNHGRLIENNYPLLSVHSECIPEQPAGIYNSRTEQIATPKILTLGRKMAKLGLKAIIVSCANDPGVVELRKELTIPIVGAGSASACLARTLGARVGIIGMGDTVPDVMIKILGHSLVGLEKPVRVRTTLDLYSKDTLNAAIAAAERLRQAGAQVIALACTGYSTINIASSLQKKIGLTVVDPILAAGLIVFYTIHRSQYAQTSH